MNGADLFVGGLAVLIGLGGLAASAGRSAGLRWSKMQWLERTVGLAVARVIYALAGLSLIALGIAIARG